MLPLRLALSEHDCLLFKPLCDGAIYTVALTLQKARCPNTMHTFKNYQPLRVLYGCLLAHTHGHSKSSPLMFPRVEVKF